jgi:hypothetical protein
MLREVERSYDREEAVMGDKSPKSKQRDNKQKTLVKDQAKQHKAEAVAAKAVKK